MMRIVFIADDFKLRTPVQQLLDRFLIGYPREGRFHKPDCEVLLALPEKNDAVERRIKDFGLQWQVEPDQADAMLIVMSPRGSAFLPKRHLELVWPARLFVMNAVPARALGIGCTPLRGAWLLPEIVVSKPVKAVVIVQGEYPQAELEGIDALLMVMGQQAEKRAFTVRNVARLEGKDFWTVLKRDFWPLVNSAISRSDSPQGNAVRDGRTEDLVRLGLLEGLVKQPRGWLIEHEDGLQYVIAVMDGAVADCNVALETRAGGIVSAQIHRGPPPAEHHYSRLAAMLENYFRTGMPPWPPEQNVYIADLFGRFAKLTPARRPDEKHVRATEVRGNVARER